MEPREESSSTHSRSTHAGSTSSTSSETKISGKKRIEDNIKTMISRTREGQESSMDRTALGNFQERYTKLQTYYAREFKRLGGVNGVINNLEEYIASQIDEYYKDRKLSFHSNITQGNMGRDPYQNQPGKAARERPEYRKEFKGELGILHTAMRALKDKEAPDSTYKNLLRVGGNDIYYEPQIGNIHLRRLLVDMWVSAIDKKPSRPIPDEHKNEKREDILKNAKGEIILALAEIQRAHNADTTQRKNSSQDYPSCPPGFFGRIEDAGHFNQLTFKDKHPFHVIPVAAEDFIFQQIKNLSDQDKKKCFDYLFFDVMNGFTVGDELDEEDQKIVDDYRKITDELFYTERAVDNFIAYLNTEYSKMNLSNYLIISRRNTLSGEKEPLRAALKEILQTRFTLFRPERDKNDTSITNGALSERVQRALAEGSVKMNAQLKVQAKIKEETEFRENYIAFEQIVKLFEKECLRVILFPSYRGDERFDLKKQSYLQGYTDSLEKLQKSKEEFLRKIGVFSQKAIEEGRTQLSAETAGTFTAGTIDPQAISGPLKDKLGRIFERQIRSLISRIEEKINLAEDKSNQINPTLIANNLFNVAFEKGYDGRFIKDEDEVRRYAEQIKNLDPDTQREIIYELLKISRSNGFYSKEEFDEGMTFIQECFFHEQAKGNKKFAFKVESIKNSPYFISSFELKMEFKKLFPIDEKSLIGGTSERVYYSARAKRSLHEEAFYEQWKESLNELYNKEGFQVTKRIELFVLRTVFKNLDIRQISISNKKNIEWLITRYLDTTKNDFAGLPFEKNLNEIKENHLKRVDYFAGHLFLLLSTLKEVSSLFNDGFIRLTSSDIAYREISTVGAEAKPYMFRVSVSKPGVLASSWFGEKEVFHSYINKNMKIEAVVQKLEKEERVVEGVPCEMIRGYTKELLNTIVVEQKWETFVGDLQIPQIPTHVFLSQKQALLEEMGVNAETIKENQTRQKVEREVTSNVYFTLALLPPRSLSLESNDSDMYAITAGTQKSTPKDEFFKWVKENNSQEVTSKLKESRYFATLTDADKKTSLHYVQSVAMAKTLINSGAEQGAQDKMGNTPLHTSLKTLRWNGELIKYFISLKNAPLDVANFDNKLPLFVALDEVGKQRDEDVASEILGMLFKRTELTNRQYKEFFTNVLNKEDKKYAKFLLNCHQEKLNDEEKFKNFVQDLGDTFTGTVERVDDVKVILRNFGAEVELDSERQIREMEEKEEQERRAQALQERLAQQEQEENSSDEEDSRREQSMARLLVGSSDVLGGKKGKNSTKRKDLEKRDEEEIEEMEFEVQTKDENSKENCCYWICSMQ